jgi:hypothetical protein
MAIRQINCFAAAITMLHITRIKKMEECEKYTFPDLWSGTTKLRIDFSPGVPNPSTVTVVKSWGCETFISCCKFRLWGIKEQSDIQLKEEISSKDSYEICTQGSREREEKKV